MFFWSESPFMTNMLKLEHHSPVFTSPSDGNSFVYSPGLEYLSYAALKPLGLHLDIRFCRLINVLVGVTAAAFAALAMFRAFKTINRGIAPRKFFFVAWGLALLVLFKNFTADIAHPDNLVILHATIVFYLSFAAMETKRFGLAVAAMIFAGVGVFAKQTQAVAFIGPAVVFAIFNPWGWRKWIMLFATGGLVFLGALCLLWLPEYAQFYTLDLPLRQGVGLRKLYWLVNEFLSVDRALLFFLAVIAGSSFWNWRNAGRRYLICWATLGVFVVLPNLASYLKAMGTWNNLIVLEVWMLLIVWPFFGSLVMSPGLRTETENAISLAPFEHRGMRQAACVLIVVLIVLLGPTKLPPKPAQFEYCHTIEERIRHDLKAGRNVLVSHGTMFLIRAGSRDVPLDRANSVLELIAGGKGNKSGMSARIADHFYDRIYLISEDWYGKELLADINENYVSVSTVKGPSFQALAALGFQALMDDCEILIPREQKPSGAQTK